LILNAKAQSSVLHLAAEKGSVEDLEIESCEYRATLYLGFMGAATRGCRNGSV
jgi:hypothetical protein